MTFFILPDYQEKKNSISAAIEPTESTQPHGNQTTHY